MKWTAFWILSGAMLAAATMVLPSAASAGPCQDRDEISVPDGRCWTSLTRVEKLQAVDALWVGMDAQVRSVQMSGNTVSYDLALDFYEHPSDATVGDIADYFDALYEISAYRKIRWENAYLLSALRQNDDDSNDGDFLTGFLRDYGYLPTFVRWIGVKAADEIVVEVPDGPIMSVRITGVDMSGMTGEGKRTAEQVLEAFRQYGGRFGCDEAGAVNAGHVRLVYRYDLFDKNGNLTADVELPGSGLCLEGQFVPYREVTLGPDRVYLSPLLGVSGILDQDSYMDPKWSRSRRNIREQVFTPVSADEAARLKEALVQLAGEAKG